MSWSPPKKDGGRPLTSYEIQISDDTKTWRSLATTEAKILSYRVKDLEEGKTYFFSVMALNEVGASEPLISDVIIPETPIGRLLLPNGKFC